MALTELPPQQPGIRLVMKSPEQESPVLARTARYIQWLREPMRRKAELNEQIFQYDKEPINIEELSRAPLFEFGHGFASEQMSDYKQGEEPALAPLSQEEMRLILVRALPTEVVPFAIDHFQFDYAPSPTGNDAPPPGPTVKIIDGKIRMTFYHSNFYTEGAPARVQHSHFESERERRSHIAAFLDPSKIAMTIGRVIGKMIARPDKWVEMISPDFQVTADKTDKKVERAKPKLPKEVVAEIRQQRQWEDFVALAVALPDIAAQRYPEAYKYYKGQLENFADIGYEKVALNRLISQSDHGTIQLRDTVLMIDPRTEDEKLEDEGYSPELAGWEKFINGFNALTSKFGFIITYKKPADPFRAALIADDDKEIKTLLEATDEAERDEMLGKILSNDGNEKNLNDKNEARRLLVAVSQAGEFNEWRIWAWLYKFSSTFRRTNGRHISENELEDLDLIYSQSEKVGNRVGTSVVPYKKVKLTPDIYPEAAIYGREVVVPTRMDYEKEFTKKVTEKVLAKTPRALIDANEKAFQLFRTPDGQWIPLTAKYNDTPEGMVTSSGNMRQLVGDQLAKDVSAWMSRAGIGKVPPDAIALAKGQEGYAKNNPREADRYMKPIAIKTIQHYGHELNEPPEIEVERLLEVPAKDIARSREVAFVGSRWNESGLVAKSVRATLGAEVSFSPLLSMTKDKFNHLVAQGYTETPALLALLQEFIESKHGKGTLANRQEYYNVLSFLFRPKTQQTLALLNDTLTYQHDLEPRYAYGVDQLAADIKKTPSLLIGNEDKIFDDPEHDLFKTLAEHKIIDIRELERQGAPTTKGDNEAEAVEGQQAELITAEQIRGARKIYLVGRLADAEESALQLASFDYIEQSIDNLDRSLATAGLGDSYNARLADWLKSGGRIFAAPCLKRARSDLLEAVSSADRPIRRVADLKKARTGLDEISGVVSELKKSIEFEREIRKEKKERKQGAPSGEREHEENA